MQENTSNTTSAKTAPVPGASSAPKAAAPVKETSVLMRLATQWGVNWRDLYNTLSKTCFKHPNGEAPTKEEMMSLLIISEQAGLNPMLGEIYAFPAKNGGIVPIVGINGWRQIATANPEYSGVRFEFSPNIVEVAGVHCNEYVKCVVSRRRKDGSSFDTEGYAFFQEKFRQTEPWKNQPRQMLFNKAQIQALKNAFPSLSSLYDDEEGKDAADVAQPVNQPTAAAPAQWDRAALDHKMAQVAQLADARGEWGNATAWVMSHTSGSDQEYALAYLARVRGQRPQRAEDAQIVRERPAPRVNEPAAAQRVQEMPLQDPPF